MNVSSMFMTKIEFVILRYLILTPFNVISDCNVTPKILKLYSIKSSYMAVQR